jgi:long-chain acyl-CoA synthetase
MEKAKSLPPVPASTKVTADHICAIIYTSGTTGNPKGVELSHRNICSEIHGVNQLWMSSGLLESQVSLAFLPWAHVFGMTCELHHFTANGKW